MPPFGRAPFHPPSAARGLVRPGLWPQSSSAARPAVGCAGQRARGPETSRPRCGCSRVRMGAWGGGEARPERRPPADRESHSLGRPVAGPRRFPAQENTTCPSPRAGRPVPRRRRFDRLTDTGRGKGSGRVLSWPGSALLLFGPAAPRCFLRAPTPRPIRSPRPMVGGVRDRSVRLSTLRLGRPGRARSPSSAQRSAGSRPGAAEWFFEPSGLQASCRSRASRSRRRGHTTVPSAKPSPTWGAPSIRSVLAETKTAAHPRPTLRASDLCRQRETPAGRQRAR